MLSIVFDVRVRSSGLLYGVLLAAFLTPLAAQERPPNILFIVADDMGYTDIGAFGSEIPTPNLDALAHRGVRFTNFHAGQACRQTRLMLMSGAGLNAANENNPDNSRGGLLGLDYATIAELLQDVGYATYMAGKWDLGELPGYTPDARGFDRSFSLLTGASQHFAELFRGGFMFAEDGRALGVADMPADFHSTNAFTDKMLEYLQSNDEGTPWFAYLTYTAPHWPLQLPDEWLDRHAGKYDAGYDNLREARFAGAMQADVMPPGASLEKFEPVTEPWFDLSSEEQRRYSRAQEIYAGMIEHLDTRIGDVIDYLEASGQLENTVVVFVSDNGASPEEYGVDTGRVVHDPYAPPPPADADNRFENFGRRGSFIDHGRGFAEAASAPFKYQKGDLTEGGLRVAAFVHYPATVSGGEVSHSFLTMMDVLPTILDIAGTEHPGAGAYRDGRQINDIVGRSAWPYLTGRATDIHSDSDTFGLTRGSDIGMVIRGEFKLTNNPHPGQTKITAWRLYNIVDDPGEHDDLAAEYPALVVELIAELEANWR